MQLPSSLGIRCELGNRRLEARRDLEWRERGETRLARILENAVRDVDCLDGMAVFFCEAGVICYISLVWI